MAGEKDVMGMTPYAISFLLTSVVMSAIILIVWIFNTLFPKAFPAKLRYAVWLVILVGMIIPFRPMIGDGLVSVQTQVEVSADSPATDLVQDTARSNAADSTSTGSPASPVTVAILVWAIVALMVLSYHIWRYIRFGRMIRRWGATVQVENTLSILETAKTEKGLGDKMIGLKVCGFVSSSMLTGFLQPVILLPEKHFEDDELELIFRHELIHYKRRDLFAKLLSVIAVSLHWFNPAIYLMCAAMQTEGEASCDEAVLLNSDRENRQFYAEVIIGMIGGKNTAGTLLSTCFYGGKSSIKRRLSSIMDTTKKMKRPAILVLAAVAMLTVLSGSIFALTQQSPAAASTLPSAAAGNTAAPTPVVSTPAAHVTQDAPAASTTSPSVEITEEQAKQIATAKAGGGTVTECKLDYENGRRVYEIKIIYGSMKYEMDVDVVTGEVSDYSQEKDSSDDDRDYDNDHD